MNIHATGDNIKRLCKRKGLTLRILADRIGVSDHTMSNWVNGHRQITAYGLLRVSRVMGVTMEKLMEGVEAEKYLPKEEPDITGDVISRQAAIDAVNCVTVMKGIRSGKSITAEAVDCAKRIIAENIRQLPPIQPKSGKWIEDKGQQTLMQNFIERGEVWRVCSVCGAGHMIGHKYECDKAYHETHHNFCPNCGAKMEATE